MKTSTLVVTACVLLASVVFLVPMCIVRPVDGGYSKATIHPTESSELSKDAGHVIGTVCDPSGAPLADAAIRILENCVSDDDLENQRRYLAGGPHAGVGSKVDGKFQLLLVPPGLYRVLASRDGMLPTISPVFEVAAGKKTILPDLKLFPIQPSDLIKGVVLDSDGTPLAWTPIWISCEWKSLWGRGSRSDSVISDSAGAFKFVVWRNAPYSVGVLGNASSVPVARVDSVLPGARGVKLVVPRN
jgi:hypothetical protein